MSRSRDLANLADEATGGLVKADIGLGNVDNTSDANKPISTAQQPYVDAIQYQGEPHIIPGVLYPAIGGNDINGTDIDTSHGSTYTYGTTHTDGRQYYYTDIKGSKPIHKPCGAFFGSQRHKFKSLQLLEQETATHGNNVYSIDGREWLRLSDKTNAWSIINDDYGHHLFWNSTTDSNEDFFEIVGYFNGANLINLNGTTQKSFAIKIDGSVNNSLTDYNSHRTTVDSPLVISRFVDAGGVTNIPISTTLGIHTLRLELHGSVQYLRTFGIELIAQDTSNRNNIQIPSQNVVSYGKKFTVSAEGNSGHHFNPFNNQAIGNTTSHGKNTTGWTSYDSTLDTATSLGLDAWVDSGNYYRPVNGGRIVKWVDSSGNIKTSVNMMPPAGRHISGGGNNGLPTGTSWLTSYQPSFMAGAIDHSQAEVAKTFNWREFGNGNANAGPVTGSTGGSYKDFSMLYEFTATNCAFVMDDGLTSLTGNDVHIDTKDVHGDANGDGFYFTFIGTGITLMNKESSAGTDHLVQNLPYGAHIVKYFRSSGADPTLVVDGVTITCATGTYSSLNELTFYQPKKPPIPEEAVVLCDYMLMADFVPQTAHGGQYISKGTRMCTNARDIFVDRSSGAVTFNQDPGSVSTGFRVYPSTNAGSNTEFKVRLPAFATNYVVRGRYMNDRALLYIGNSTTTSTYDNNDAYGSYAHLTNDENLGIQNWGMNSKSGKQAILEAFCFATPTHTSSHYQSFETPFLHELVGGDRNMEQTNLVCSPDGKTWDQLTRDTTYLGDAVLQITEAGDAYADNTTVIFTDIRGTVGNRAMFNKKHFAIAYDRQICLISGTYVISPMSMTGSNNTGGHVARIYLNGSHVVSGYGTLSGYSTATNQVELYLNRGDYIQIKGLWHANSAVSSYRITKVRKD